MKLNRIAWRLALVGGLSVFGGLAVVALHACRRVVLFSAGHDGRHRAGARRVIWGVRANHSFARMRCVNAARRKMPHHVLQLSAATKCRRPPCRESPQRRPGKLWGATMCRMSRSSRRRNMIAVDLAAPVQRRRVPAAPPTSPLAMGKAAPPFAAPSSRRLARRRAPRSAKTRPDSADGGSGRYRPGFRACRLRPLSPSNYAECAPDNLIYRLTIPLRLRPIWRASQSECGKCS